MSCINKNSQEFKHLVMQSKLPDRVVEAKVSIWQQEHGLDSFPTIEDLPGIKEIKSEVKEQVLVERQDDYKNQIVNLKRSIARVEGSVKKQEFGSPQYTKFKAMEVAMKDALAKYETSKNKAYLYELAEIELGNIEGMIKSYEKGNREVQDHVIAELLPKLDSFYQLDEVATKVKDLKTRYTAVMAHLIQTKVEETSNKKEGLTYDELQQDTQDISSFTKYTGGLINLPNRIARTIAVLIKQAQINISSEQGNLHDKVKKRVTALENWAKANGKSMSETYDMFIQDMGNTTVLTRPYKTEFYKRLNESLKAKDKQHYKFATFDEELGHFVPIDKRAYANPNYTEIFKKGNEELATFYKFYQDTIKEALDKLPLNAQTEWLKKHPEDFIPNVFTETMSDILKTKGFGNKVKNMARYISGVKTYEIMNDDFVKDEELERDVIPLKYITKLTGDNKSKDLGESLFKFGAMAIEHEHLTEILPTTRLLQRSIADNKFINPHKSKLAINGEDSNLYEMIEGFIQMQILGNKTKGKDELKIENIKDEEGNIVGKKVIKMGELADFGLKWNSLLRIGLNPITAFTNVFVGEVGNITEAMGGRFFNAGDLNKATGIFTSQILGKESKTNALIEKYPMLQELTDYEYADNVSIKKGLSGEQLKNYMYAPQKAGEVFLQTRTMIAMMLHTKPDGKTSLWEMLDDKGEIKPEYLKHFGTKEDFKEYMLRNSTKIMGVNEQIHGRYSTRDAAILNQNVIARMTFQFKKWIPAAIEVRFGGKQYNDRLMVETEGRWNTFAKMVWNIKDTLDRQSKGQLTELEVYNFRKTMTEATIFLATIMGALALGWDDDEKRKKSPMYKFTMDQLDKVSGDLLFLSNPKNVTAMTKNPIAMTKLVNSLIDVVKYIPYAAYVGGEENYEIKSGAHKGENKFYRSLGTVIPGYNQLGQNLPELWNERKYVDRTN